MRVVWIAATGLGAAGLAIAGPAAGQGHGERQGLTYRPSERLISEAPPLRLELARDRSERSRSAKISYAVGGGLELFVDLQKARGRFHRDADGAVRDWTAFQDRNRKAYAVGFSKRW